MGSKPGNKITPRKVKRMKGGYYPLDDKLSSIVSRMCEYPFCDSDGNLDFINIEYAVALTRVFHVESLSIEISTRMEIIKALMDNISTQDDLKEYFLILQETKELKYEMNAYKLRGAFNKLNGIISRILKEEENHLIDFLNYEEYRDEVKYIEGIQKDIAQISKWYDREINKIRNKFSNLGATQFQEEQ